MHELSIALSIVELVRQEAERRKVEVEVVHLRLGALSSVVKEALMPCYEIACQNTPLEGSRLEVEDVPVVISCPRCRLQRPLSSLQSFRCPECGTPTSEVVKGKELEIVALEIRECVPSLV